MIATLAALTAVAPFSIDMYLSAFPAMARDLHTSPSSIQLTMTAFLIGLASGQLVIGPLSDRCGRRPPLIAGSAICLGVSTLCSVAPIVEILIGLRFVQGFASAAGVVIARAIIADRSHGRVALKVFSNMTLMTVLAPIAAPILGGAVVTAFGWRAVFAVLAVLNLSTLLGVVLFVGESLPRALRRPDGLKALAAGSYLVLINRRYLGYTAASAFISAAMFGFVSASPFVLQDIVGLSTAAYSSAFAACSLAVALGSVVARGTVSTVAPRRVMEGGVTALVVITALILCTVTIGGVHPVSTIALMGCFMAGVGFLYGHSAMLATTQVRHAAGTGSAIFGFAQYTAGAVASPLVGLAGHSSASPMGLVMFGATSAAAVALFITRRSDGGDGYRRKPLRN
ncbi:multidrug effflux MFS transporter [Mycolicibacterium litorale]|uniref:multidrug effflux MFS transporter n=1 Tax=Mycolicibacterium litorale TaxID=758802 RepID=UPI0010EF7281|nr:multidrug effflux MFS transporter [Mycolicibacterium litorale]TDY06741.1 DHA1 family bicyclomycin/chloramphenicol resistance-like MFS transporter [Mycolicibacterium litorale]